MDIHVLGIDLGKNSCSVVRLDATGRVVMRRRMRRESVVASRPSCRAASERWRRAVARTISGACWARRDTRLG